MERQTSSTHSAKVGAYSGGVGGGRLAVKRGARRRSHAIAGKVRKRTHARPSTWQAVWYRDSDRRGAGSLSFILLTWNLANVFSGWHPGWPAFEQIAVALAASLLFFACILLHELAHSLVAGRRGLRVRSITLFLFGGVSEHRARTIVGSCGILHCCGRSDHEHRPRAGVRRDNSRDDDRILHPRRIGDCGLFAAGSFVVLRSLRGSGP